MRSIGSFLSLVALAILFLTTSYCTPPVVADDVAVVEEPADAIDADDEVDEFLRSAAQGDREALRAALDEGMDIDAVNDAGLTALHVARMRGFTQLAEQLVAWGADDSIPMPSPGALADRALAKDRPEDGPALVALVAKDGQVLWERAYGYADIKGNIAAGKPTKFRIGSVTKQFTASAILKLQEEGKLSVDDKLTRFFPDFPRGDEVTLDQLLHHTSGIHSYTSERLFGVRVINKIEADDLIEEIKGYDFDFDPGEKHLYCNSGYFLLGRIVELASGESYGDYLRSRFFEPLEMHDTGVYINGTEYEHEALGYSYKDDKYRKAKAWDMSWAGGAGNIYSTTRDLMRWNEGVFGGKVLSAESLEAAFAPAILNDGSTEAYGYGWAISKPRGIRKISHNGGLDGFASYLARYPDQNVTVVAFSNCLPPGSEVSAYAAGPKLAEIFLWEAFEPRTEETLDPTVDTASLGKYAGRYDYGGAIMTVTQDGEQFYAQLSGQQAFKIFPKSETHFFLRAVEASIEFVLNEDGEVDHVIHRQNGREFNAPRIGEVKLVTLTAEQLDQFVGQYSYGTLGTLKVTREDDRLMAQLTGQPALEIRPISETAFAWVDVHARIEFDLDDEGNITGATHYQGGQELPVTVVSEKEPS